MADAATMEAPPAIEMTDAEKRALADFIATLPSVRANSGPSIFGPGDPHYTWEDFERDSPGAQAAIASQAQELANALAEIEALKAEVAAAKAAQDPAARAAELRAELAAVEASIPSPDLADPGAPPAVADPGAVAYPGAPPAVADPGAVAYPGAPPAV